MIFPSLNEQMDIIRAGAHEVFPEQELAQKIERSLKTGKPMLAKLGCDPSRPDLHIGHAVVLNKMRQFQDMGHNVVLIIGDFTAMIGDPTGKSKTRPALTIEETRINGQSYIDQAKLVLDIDKARIVYNSEWLGTMHFADVIKLAAQYTVSQMLERDDFHKRFESEIPISIHEFLYPLAQAMDSVHLQNDIELGGTDQKFNLLVGRYLMRSYSIEPQCVLTMPILEGTDGIEKMSKSLDNFIALTDTPREMFGKTMSIPDALIARYLQLGAFAPTTDVEAVSKGLQDGTIHPRTAKVETAMKIVARYHGEEAGRAAFEEFERIFVKKDIPDVIETYTLPDGETNMNIVDILALTQLAPSKSEARRLIQGGGVSVDGEKISEPTQTIDFSARRLLKVGKRKFLYVSCGV
jgi:tyrosyl-tRNA synthetase